MILIYCFTKIGACAVFSLRSMRSLRLNFRQFSASSRISRPQVIPLHFPSPFAGFCAPSRPSDFRSCFALRSFPFPAHPTLVLLFNAPDIERDGGRQKRCDGLDRWLDWGRTVDSSGITKRRRVVCGKAIRKVEPRRSHPRFPDDKLPVPGCSRICAWFPF